MPTGIYTRTEEHKKNLSKAHMGIKGYWTGKKRSEEDKEKIRKSQTGKKHTEETKQKLSLANTGKNLGKKCSEETRKKMSLAHIGSNNHFFGKKHSEETREKISLAHAGKKIFEGTRKKMSLAHLGKKLSKETKKKISLANTNRKRSEETKKKMSLAHIGEKHSEAHKRKNSLVHIGENNPRWLGGISYEPYTKEFNRTFKNRIRKRDNGICMYCGIHREQLKKALSVHHLNYVKTQSYEANAISLCNSCHGRTNNNRKHWIKFFQSLLAERYGYEYEDGNIVIIYSQ